MNVQEIESQSNKVTLAPIRRNVKKDSAVLIYCVDSSSGHSEYQEISLRQLFVEISNECYSESPSTENTENETALKLRARDLRRLDFAINQNDEFSIVVRKHVILFTVDPIRAIITSQKLRIVVPPGADSLMRFLDEYIKEWFADKEEYITRISHKSPIKDTLNHNMNTHSIINTNYQNDNIMDSNNGNMIIDGVTSKNRIINNENNDYGNIYDISPKYTEDSIYKDIIEIQNDDLIVDITNTEANDFEMTAVNSIIMSSVVQDSGINIHTIDDIRTTTTITVHNDNTSTTTNAAYTDNHNNDNNNNNNNNNNKNNNRSSNSNNNRSNSNKLGLNSTNTIELYPFEIYVYDAILSTIKDIFQLEYNRLLQYVQTITILFDKSSLMVSPILQEKVLTIKEQIIGLLSKVNRYRLSLEHVIEDDILMALMNITYLMKNPSLYQYPMNPALLHLHEIVEETLESYLMDFTSLQSHLELILSKLLSIQTQASIKLSIMENKSFYILIFFSSCYSVFTFGAYLAGMFATNLDQTEVLIPINGIWRTVFICSFIVMIILPMSVYGILRYKKIILNIIDDTVD